MIGITITIFVIALVRGHVSTAWSVPQRNPSDLHHVLFVGDLIVAVQLRTLDYVHRFFVAGLSISSLHYWLTSASSLPALPSLMGFRCVEAEPGTIGIWAVSSISPNVFSIQLANEP